MTSVEWMLGKPEVQVEDLAVFKIFQSTYDMFSAVPG